MRVVCRSTGTATSGKVCRKAIRDSITPFNHKEAENASEAVLTQLRPDGVRQPSAEAWVLIEINMRRLGLGSGNPKY